MATRIANLANNKLIQSVIAQTQSRITDRQLQISTLQKSQDYAGISSESNRLVTLEASRRRVDQFLQEGAFVKLRMDTMLNSVDALKKTLSDVKGFINEVLEDGALPNGVDKDEFANVKISEIQDYLNVKVAGRYLFAGSLTETKPVDIDPIDVATEPFDPPATATTTVAEPSFYYEGDDTKVKARINEGLEIQYGITAAEPGFEKLIRAVRIIRSVPLDGTGVNVTQKYQHARDLVNEALEDMQSTELNIGTKVEQLHRTGLQLKDTKSFLSGAVSDLESADTFEAVAELTQDQTMLEASYNTLVRLSNLSMIKFL
jgi:flagellar hook-associated protein 3 FlgL